MPLRKLFLLTLFTLHFSLFTNLSFSQDQKLIDSLQNELRKFDAHKKELGSRITPLMDSTGANILYEIIKEYWAHNTDSALKYDQQLLMLSENIGYKKGIGNAYNGFGLSYMGNRKLALAMEYYRKALKIRTEINDKEGLGWTYNNMGMIGGDLGLPTEGIKYHYKAIKVREEIGDSLGLSASYGKIGLLYLGLGNYPEALKSYFIVLKIGEDIKNKEIIAMGYQGIGHVYSIQENLPEALKYYTLSLNISKESGVKISIANEYSYLGNIYYKQGNYDEAIKSELAAIKESEGIWNIGVKAECHRYLGQIYLAKGDYDEALNYCMTSLKEFQLIQSKQAVGIINIEIAEVLERQGKFREALDFAKRGLDSVEVLRALDVIKNGYNRLSEINADMHNYKEAYNYHVLYQQMKDTIFNNANASKMKAMEMQYDFDKDAAVQKAEQDKKDVMTQLEIQKQKNIKFRILAGVGVLIAFVIILIFRNRNKQKMKVLEMRQGISRDLHDEIGASLSSVQLMSSFAAESLNGSSPDAKQWMNRIGENTTDSMEKIRDIVWTLNSSNDISGNIITRMNQFISHSLEPKDIVCNFISDDEVNDVLSDFVRKRNVYLIFKEAVNNAAKYSEATEVNIKFKIENKKLLLTIHDDGKGFDTTILTKGNGLNNMLYRARQINAILEIKSSKEEGTFISLQMPVTSLRYKFLRKSV